MPEEQSSSIEKAIICAAESFYEMQVTKEINNLQKALLGGGGVCVCVRLNSIYLHLGNCDSQ